MAGSRSAQERPKDVRLVVGAFAVAMASAVACAHVENLESVRLVASVEFKDAAGERAFRIEADGGDVRIEDASGAPLVVLRAGAGGLTISDGRRRRLGLVQPLGRRPGFRVLTGEGGETLLELKAELDGDLSLRTSGGQRLYQIKRRDYGFKVLDAQGRLQSKIRSRPNKTSVRNASGQTYLSTRDSIPAAAVAALALDDVRFAHAAALCVAIIHWGLPEGAGGEPVPES